MRKSTFLAAGLSVSAFLPLNAAAQTQAEFIPLGFLPGVPERLTVNGVSDDGAVVVGTAGAFPDERPFMWTRSGGLVELPRLPDGSGTTRAEGVSGDGNVIVGLSRGRAVRWVNGAIEELGFDPESPIGTFAYPVAASFDGSVIVGEGEHDTEFRLAAVRWTESAKWEDLGFIAGSGGTFEAIATNVSADGTTVVGYSEFAAAEAFRWTQTDGMIGLGFLPGGGSFSVSTALSADGSIIGGQSDVPGGWDACVWINGAIDPLPALGSPATKAHAVRDMTSDGSIIVGMNTGLTPTTRSIFVWDAVNGSRDLLDILDDLNTDLLGYQLVQTSPATVGSVAGISGDGTTIIGNSPNPNGDPEGWVIIFSEVPDCPADLNNDGVVDADDFFLFLQWFADADPRADINNDGVIDADDFFDYLALFAQGC